MTFCLLENRLYTSNSRRRAYLLQRTFRRDFLRLSIVVFEIDAIEFDVFPDLNHRVSVEEVMVG